MPRRRTSRISGAQEVRARSIGHHTSERNSGAMRVPGAPLERSAVMASPTKGTGGNTQFTSPAHGAENASVHTASGWKNRAQNRPEWGGCRAWQLSRVANR